MNVPSRCAAVRSRRGPYSAASSSCVRAAVTRVGEELETLLLCEHHDLHLRTSFGRLGEFRRAYQRRAGVLLTVHVDLVRLI